MIEEQLKMERGLGTAGTREGTSGMKKICKNFVSRLIKVNLEAAGNRI
jgi:hypothetical protein